MPIDTPHKCPYCYNQSLSYYQTVGALDFFTCDNCFQIVSVEMIFDNLEMAVNA